jgi:hypothetical protein
VNFKRRRSKNQRAGCLLCKPHKANGAKKKDPPAVRRKDEEITVMTRTQVEALMERTAQQAFGISASVLLDDESRSGSLAAAHIRMLRALIEYGEPA